MNLIGYKKISFCGQQAKRDGLQYFWVDTCSIDCASRTQLIEAISSIFLWYRNAAKCYVYLSNVSIYSQDATNNSHLPTAILSLYKLYANTAVWQAAFRRSQWFTRAWTLPELAPISVEFFSSEGRRLGNKESLQDLLQEIT